MWNAEKKLLLQQEEAKNSNGLLLEQLAEIQRQSNRLHQKNLKHLRIMRLLVWLNMALLLLLLGLLLFF
jgi:hypothetical protein